MVKISAEANDLIDQADDAIKYVAKFLLWPQAWQGLDASMTYTWQRIKFTESEIAKAPDNEKGIYSFVVEPDIAGHPGCKFLFYIGMTEDQVFRKRFRNYFDELTRKKPKRTYIINLMKKWPDNLYCYYTPIPPGTNSADVESKLIGAFIPPLCKNLPIGVRDVVKAFFS